MPFFASPVFTIDPTIKVKAVAILIPLLAAHTQLWRIEANMLFHYQSSSFYYFPRRTSTNALDKSMLARFAVAQY
jgi:hypothetical protein